MKKLSQLNKEEKLIIEGKDYLVEVSEIKEYIKGYEEQPKVYLAIKKNRHIDNSNIEIIIEELSDTLYSNDELIEDDYLEATEEEMKQLEAIFNNILSRTTDVYEAGEEIEIDI